MYLCDYVRLFSSNKARLFRGALRVVVEFLLISQREAALFVCCVGFTSQIGVL